MTSHKTLVVGPAWVGDMVMAQCLFKLIKQRHPETTIDVLAPAWSLPLLERMPETATSIIMPLGHGKLGLKERYQLGKQLRNNNYQQAIVLPNSFKSALIPWFANIPLRTGWRGEMRWGVLNDIRHLDEQRYPLMIERFMALGQPPTESLMPRENYPLPELQAAPDSIELTRNKYNLTTENPVLVLCPGAEFGPAKRWPEEHYAAVANAKLAEGWQVWLLGSPKDSPVAEKIMQLTQQRCINLTGRTSLVEAIDSLSLATAVLSNDSGLMHIAAALHKPVVVVYGPTSAAFTPPLHQQAKILTQNLSCQPCFQRECPLVHQACMRELSPHLVLQTLTELVT
jgi:heptosyltransferase-2